jgi:hypothetical protein
MSIKETSKALKLEAQSVEGRKKNMEAWRITLSRNCRQTSSSVIPRKCDLAFPHFSLKNLLLTFRDGLFSHSYSRRDPEFNPT